MDFHSWAGPPWLQALSKNDRPLQSSAERINIAEMAETSPMPARYRAIKDVFPVLARTLAATIGASPPPIAQALERRKLPAQSRLRQIEAVRYTRQ